MTAVVQVRMGQHDIGDQVCADRQRLPVQAPPGPFTLVEAAVHQGLAPLVLEQELAAGDRACGPKERECGDHGVVRVLPVSGYGQCQLQAVLAAGNPNVGHVQ